MDSRRIDRVISDQLFALLRAGLWGEEVDTIPFASVADVDWRTLFDRVRAQAVIGIAYDGMERLPESVQPLRGIYLQWSDATARIERANAQLNRVMCEVTEMYQSIGIVPVVLKGQGIAMHYAHPERRQCGDVDIYVSPANYRLANNMLVMNGAVVAGEANQKHASYQYKGVHIENHRLIGTLNTPCANRHFQHSISQWYPHRVAPLTINVDRAGWEEEFVVLTPPVEFNRIYLLQHAFAHFLNSGIGIRHLCDWSRFLYNTRHEPIDRGVTDGQLRRLGLMNAAQAFTYLAVKHLGLPVEALPFSYNEEVAAPLGKRLLNDIWCTGNFGQYDSRIAPRPQGYWAGKWYTFTRATRRCRKLKEFAPAEARWYAMTLVQGTLAIQWNRLRQWLKQ